MLRTVASDQFDLGAALERSARMLFHESGVRMQFQYPSLPRSNSALLEAQLLRIGQEALTNAFKHSRATELSLSIAQTEESLHLEIRDNGVGFFPELEEDCSHFGLQGMRERAARIGADLVVESDCSTGTCVQVKVPLRTGSAIFPQLA